MAPTITNVQPCGLKHEKKKFFTSYEKLYLLIYRLMQNNKKQNNYLTDKSC